MLWDITKVVSGDGHYISVPEPMTGYAPVGYISLNDNVPFTPLPLSVGLQNPVSRRSQGYSMRHSGSVPHKAASTGDISDYEENDDEYTVDRDIENAIVSVESMTTTTLSKEEKRVVSIPLQDPLIKDRFEHANKSNVSFAPPGYCSQPSSNHTEDVVGHPIRHRRTVRKTP